MEHISKNAHISPKLTSFYLVLQEDLDKEQLALLKKAFEAFDHEKKGCIDTGMIGTILNMLNVSVTDKMLNEIIAEVDADGKNDVIKTVNELLKINS